MPALDVSRLAKVDWSAKTKVSPKTTAGKPFQLEVRGTYGVRVVDLPAFKASMHKVGASSDRDIQRALETLIKRRLRTLIRESVQSSDQVAAQFNAVAQETRLGVKHQFSRMGLDLVDFLVTSIRSSEDRCPATAVKTQPRRNPTATISKPRVGRAAELGFPRRRS